ncbi:hypothetical protein SCHPADRAFT_946904 [Schizopora paradoxa]|uniref:Uncharacterized protein n=1 Tax=Schizopora paradoxa TaxID=27342 RepID=A0A0H2R187_9AGAM|nr:hypothetical protein SCHPADRAFT_946904 [Schizopora paradoxa]
MPSTIDSDDLVDHDSEYHLRCGPHSFSNHCDLMSWEKREISEDRERDLRSLAGRGGRVLTRISFAYFAEILFFLEILRYDFEERKYKFGKRFTPPSVPRGNDMARFKPAKISTATKASKATKATNVLPREVYNHPRNIQSKLATETLLDIFRESTFTPELLNSNLCNPFDNSQLTFPQTVEKAITDAEETKIAILKVTERWKIVSDPYTFEYVYLDESAEWTYAMHNFARSIASESYPAGGACIFVRRIDFATSTWTLDQIMSAIFMLSFCPNLKFIIFGLDVGTETIIPDFVINTFLGVNISDAQIPALQSIISSYGSNANINTFTGVDVSGVHTLAFRSLLSSDSVTAILNNAHRFTNLHSLSLRFQSLAIYVKTPSHVVVLPALHSLEIVSDDPSLVLFRMRCWKMKSLRRVSLRSQYELNRSSALAFFGVHGHKLTILEFDLLPHGLMKEILKFCPNVVDIVTDIMYANMNGFEAHHSVERIGLRGFSAGRYSTGYNHFVRTVSLDCFERLFPILAESAQFPNLTLVRLLDYDQSNFGEQGWTLSDAKQWAFYVELFSDKYVRFEDHDGKDIDVPTDENSFLAKQTNIP